MNKRKIEGIIWFVVGFILVLLMANKSSMLSDNVGENIFALILSGITLFFGKMTWFIAIGSMIYGIIIFFYEKIGFHITQGKIVALIGLFLSWSMILIRGSVVKGHPLANTFTEAGRKLLEIGFNRESGGIPGALLSMPFYSVLHLKIMLIGLIVLVIAFLGWLIKDMIELGYELLKEVMKYYKSDDYKEKKRKLAAKKYAENLKKTDYKRYQREMLKAKIIQSRNEKLSFEIAKKPKDNFLQKTEVYSKEELAEKEKEWIELFEEKEKEKQSNLQNMKKNSNEQKNDVKESELKLENIVKPSENVKSSETVEEQNEKTADSEKFEDKKEETEENKKIEKKVEIKEKAEKEDKREPKLEIVTPLRREMINSAQMDPNFQEFPKLEAFENPEVVEKGFEEELKKVNAMFDNNKGYDDVVKKSISEIFKSKPMDLKKKEQIEKT